VLHKGQLSRPETEARARPENFRPGAPATCAQHRDVVEGTHTRIDSRELVTAGVGAALSSAVTALLLSPIATELPETMNAIIWVRQGKIQLALANISGAMMIQATVPSGLGLLFTDWRLDHALLWSGAITMAAITYLLVTMRANKLTPTETSGRPCFRWRGRRHRNGADLAQTGPNW
jgi:cation:H+ antiporter